MRIVYLSGIDGCGKTTQAKALTKWLREQGAEAEYHWLRWEPSILPLIRSVRRILSGKKAATGGVGDENREHGRWVRWKEGILRLAPLSWLWLQYAAWDYSRSARRTIAEWKGDVIVLDRYLFDFAVDQAINLGLSLSEFRKRAKKTSLAKMPEPDLSVFIHIPAAEGYRRKQDGTPLEYLESREAFYRVLPESQSVLHVDGMRSVEEIQAEIRLRVGERSDLRGEAGNE
ncbi:hypothetical protein HQ520_13185 [bacterium]|nr:hypothetical protein [bacterium]